MSKNKIVVFLIFYSVQFFSQNKAIDSLKNIIAQSKVDTIKLYNLNRLIEILNCNCYLLKKRRFMSLIENITFNQNF